MPNDTLDEIEARLRDDPAYWRQHNKSAALIRTLIEMVRARDKVADAAREVRDAGAASPRAGTIPRLYAALAALDTPPAQEQKR